MQPRFVDPIVGSGIWNPEPGILCRGPPARFPGPPGPHCPLITDSRFKVLHPLNLLPILTILSLVIERSAPNGYSIVMKNGKHSPPKNIEVIDDAMAEVLRAKTGAQRLVIASGMYTSARRMLIGYLKTQHPDWSESQISAEAARRLSHGAI